MSVILITMRSNQLRIHMLHFIPLFFVLLYQTEDAVYLKGRWQKREKMDNINGYYVKSGQAGLIIRNQRLNFTYLCDFDTYQIQVSNFSLAIDDTQIQHFDINFTRNPNNKYIQNINKEMMKNGPLSLIIKDYYFDIKIDYKTTFRFYQFKFIDRPLQFRDMQIIKILQFVMMIVMMVGVVFTSLMRYKNNRSDIVGFQPVAYNTLYCWAINCESYKQITILIVILMFSYIYVHLVLVLNRNLLNRSRLSIPKIIMAILMMIMIKKSYLNESHVIWAAILYELQQIYQMFFADYTARQIVFGISELSLNSQIQQIFLAVLCILCGFYKQQISFTDLYQLRIILFIFISALIQRVKRNLLKTIIAAKRLK